MPYIARYSLVERDIRDKEKVVVFIYFERKEEFYEWYRIHYRGWFKSGRKNESNFLAMSVQFNQHLPEELQNDQTSLQHFWKAVTKNPLITVNSRFV